MKKHSFSVILLAASLLSAGFVTSCKDNDSDMFTELDREQATLKQALQSQISDLESKISALENKKECTCAISEEWAKTLSSGSFEDAYAQYYAGVYATQTDLSAALDSAKSAYDYASTLLPLIETNADSIVAFQTKLITINSLIDQAQKSANDALRFAQNDSVVLRDSIGHLRADLGILGADLGALTDTVNGMNGKVTQAVTDAAEALAKAIDTESRFEALSLKVDTLSDALSDSCAVLRQVADSLYSKAVSTAKSYADGLVVSLNSRMSTLETLVKTYENRISANESAIKTLKTDVSSLKTDVAALKSRLSKLENRVSIVEDNLKMLITGIIIQGTEDPIFGYAALPFGIQTNILAGYYGDALTNGVEFPTTKSGKYVYGELTDEEKAVAGFTTKTYAADTIYAGKIYFTLNPSTVDFTNVKGLTLESSAENASPIHLKDVKKSTEELWFGITRAGDNGFYEATAYILPKEAPSAAPHFDLTAMKQVGNQLLNEKTFDLSSAVSALYQSVSRISPRYGLKAAWKNADSVNVAVYSNYAAATVAVQPLSYNFLYGKTVDLGYTIPSIDASSFQSVLDSIMSKIKIELEFPKFSLGVDTTALDFSALEKLDLSFNIDWDNINMGSLGTMDSIEVKFQYDIPGYDVNIEYGKKDLGNGIEIDTVKSVTLIRNTEKDEKNGGNGTAKIDLNSTMSSVYSAMADTIKSTLASVIDSISSQLSSVSSDLSSSFTKLKTFTTTITGLEGTINDLFSDVSKTLTDQIEAVKTNLSTSINTMMSGYVTTLNSYISQINNVISNVTSLISDPNSKLQPILLYTTSSGASSYLSTSATLPTSVKVSGSGKQGVTLVATSYTGELLAPAYKKYIAVVNVTDPDGNSAQGGNATCQKAADVANQEAQTNFNTVLDGGKRGVVFTTSDAYVGYTYEIAYAAVDYSGNMVARRFYVKVTK